MTPWSLALVLTAFARTLVLPFEMAGDASTLDWKGSAFEEAISAHLVSAGQPVVEVSDRNRLLGEMGFLPGEPLTRATAIVVARELGASRLIVGSYQESETAVEVTARLIDIDRGTNIGVVEDVARPAELLALQNQVAKNLLRIEREEAPAVADACARRRRALPVASIEASARARLTLDVAERERYLEQALAAAPDYLEARLDLGRLLLAEGRTRDAVDVLAHARGEDGLYRDAYFDLGVAYLREGASQAALEVFRNLAGQQKTAAVYTNLGVALMRTERPAEAIEAFETALELGAGRPTYAFNLGWSYWRAGKGARALALFEKATEADPLDAEARLLLAAASSSQALPEQAATRRAQALLLAPELAEVEAATVQGWERPVDRGGARTPVTAIRAFPDEDEVDLASLANLLDARSLRAEGRVEDAIRALQRSLYRKPGAIDVRHELADLHIERGDFAQAASELSVVLWTDPSAEGHVALARVYLRMDELEKAQGELEQALALDPSCAEARTMWSELGPAGEEPPLVLR